MPAAVRSALRVSAASALWTLATSTAAIALGLADGSLALVAFGAVQLFDLAGSVVLIVHFRVGEKAVGLERVVLRVVAAGLVAVGLVTVVVSGLHLLNHDASGDAAGGVPLAAAAFAILTVLAIRKRQLATRLPSPALRADGNLTAVGAALAAVTVVGTAAANGFGWWWADPVAALTIAIVALGVGATTSRLDRA